jgi:SAM-dependent methyltransferase
LRTTSKEIPIMANTDVREMVRERYGAVARGGTIDNTEGESACCGPSCCGGGGGEVLLAKTIGYSDAEMAAVPDGANLGLGCGNPTAIASIKPGETVLDLGSGGGFDCFLAANQVGPEGRVIGVDMTSDMLSKARGNAAKGGYTNVEFRLGEIEALPVADASVDLIMSNCVINLSPDKPRVFGEAFRVLKPGGRVSISDIVLLGTLPDAVRESATAYASCVGGALPKDDYLGAMADAGFVDIEVASETAFPESYFTGLADPLADGMRELSAEDLHGAVNVVRSLRVLAKKPASTRCCG